MDGRRHSVDLPISKTLIALRRVRSLRDPDTNSLSRLSNFVDNINLETNYTNEVVLEHDDNCQNNLGLFRARHSDDHVVNWEAYHAQNTHKPKSGLCNNYNDLPCTMPTRDFMEGMGSCNETMELFLDLQKQDNNGFKRRSNRRNRYKPSKVVGGDILSCVSSPCLSISDASFGGSSCGTPLYENKTVDNQETDYDGCGIGSCWSSTPGFQEIGVSKHYCNETTPFSESPRCLSQKFRPKSFDELVGQNTVSKSLLNAISSQKIASFYLFHGPRGTGKTSAARVFAAALNCLLPDKKKPCGNCQECTLFFAGRSRDVKEVDSVSMNQAENLRYLLKNAMLPPVSSSFKVFIIDECQLMHGSTWSTLVNCIEEVSRHIVFIMITPDLSNLPRGVIPMSQRFQFLKIGEADIAQRLVKICSEEGFDYDQVALEFISTRSNGSLRDAEMTLEQLSLLGKRITMSLTYEIIGIVSDEELLELLAMALSSDTSNTVKRARELMRSRIDPMQLISQLANLIMDILAGKFQDDASEVKRQFFERHTSEAELQQLNNALKILSETEKQLRASKNQTTWLTVALLQLSSAPSFNPNDSSLCVRSEHPRVSADESLKHLVLSQCNHNNGCESETLKDKVALELIWSRSMELCKYFLLSNFLKRHGKLTSVCFHQGLAVVELEFQHPNYASKAEKSWKLIASALQAALGCNVEIRICQSDNPKFKKSSFRLFGCARRNKKHVANLSENTNGASDSGPHGLHTCEKKEAARAIRNSDGNALSVDFSGQELCRQPCCYFPRSVKDHKKIRSLDLSMTSETDNNLALAVSESTSSKPCSCAGGAFVICGLCKKITCCNGVQRQKKVSKVHCWKSPMVPLKKAWQLRLRSQGA
ncbi:protein STICHEL-like 2 [Bidens hawaiensis]|uniref:protein STICHEL-like 2 n=1 Tax=Bidens hawaiensis TaxID=980011 RepID=UPI00404AFBA6